MPWPHIVLKPSLCMNSTPACESGRSGGVEQRTVHVRVAARFEHERAPEMVVVLPHVLALFEDRSSFDRRKAADDQPQRLARGVGVDGVDAKHASKSLYNPPMPILLTEADVRDLLTMDDLIETMEGALADFSRRQVTQPLRTVLEVGAHQSFYGVMPAYLPTRPALGTKLVTVFEGNPARGLPTHLATIVLLDPDTGALLALLDGRYITEARTAAVSAVSVRHLSRPDAGVLAIIGTGVQARSHLEAIGRVRQLREVRVWSPTAAHAHAFVERDERARPGADPRRRRRRAGGRGGRRHRARHRVEGARAARRLGRGRRPYLRRRRVPADAPRDGRGAGRARGSLRRLTSGGAGAKPGTSCWRSGKGRSTPTHIRGEIGEVVGGTVAGRRDARPRHDLQVARAGGRRCRGRAPGLRTRAGRPARRGVRPGTRRIRGRLAPVHGRALTCLSCARPSASSSSRRSACGPRATSCAGSWCASARPACFTSATAADAAAAAPRADAPAGSFARRTFACAVSAASRSRVATISRSIPPMAQPIISADFNSTSPWPFFRPRGICNLQRQTVSGPMVTGPASN